VAAAVSSGAPGLEAAAVVNTDGVEPGAESVAAVRDLGPDAPLLVAERHRRGPRGAHPMSPSNISGRSA